MDTEIMTLLENRKNMENFTIALNDVLKDTDDEQLKEEVRSYLGEISQVYRFFVVGAEQAGRTTFLRKCFLNGDENLLETGETEGIWELRYGVQEAIIPVEDGYHRRFISNSILEGLSLIDVGSKDVYKRECANKLAKNADVILAIFSVENVQDENTWDFIEKNALKKKIVCILTKADLYPSEIEKKKEKLLDYMKELNISTPVFAVSDKTEDFNTYKEIQSYIRRNIIGTDPAEKKKRDNFNTLIKIHSILQNSVKKRSRQYMEDKRVLEAMDVRIKEFYDVQEEKIRKLKDVVIQTIRDEINNYQNSILRQFDPKELKRNPNTQKKKIFMDWLQHEVNRYETILNNRISEQTNKVMRHYIADIDDICRDMQECMEERKIFLEENDSFYGSLAKSKSAMVKKTSQFVAENHEDYQTLMQASEELFDKIWEERRKRDLKVAETVTASTAVVGAAGAAAAVMLAPEELIFAAAIVAVLVFGSIGYAAGKKLGEMFFDGKMEKNAEKYIEEFKESIMKTRELMESKTLEKLDELFKDEFAALDKYLLQFRTMSNIDAKNIPLLESRMQELDSLVDIWKREEEVYEYC